jgi:arylsulfatase
VLPVPAAPFTGTLSPTERDSSGNYAEPIKAPDGAPNIVLVMTDDVGFAASTTFGGPIPTPTLDRLAASGLRYNEFHTTAICSPTRAALLTGRNHHAVGTGMLADLPSPYPGYTGAIPRSAATVARVLRDNGYNTAMFGKTHNVPQSESSAAGPFDRWPTGLGFEYFYGNVGGDTDQWQPALYEGTVPVDGSHRPADYILDRDLADHALRWLHNQKAAAPDKPFFIYYALGSGHAPHQAPAEWIAKFRNKFDTGWDKQREVTLEQQKAKGIVPANTALASRPDVIPAWDTLSADEKKVNARYMEVYAGMIAFQDAQLGRLFDEIERMGLSSNTLVVFIEGDNGASGEGGPTGALNEVAHLQATPGAKQETPEWLARNLDLMGGPKTYEIYPVGWALAMNTPFPWVKQLASHLGGVRNGLVISWPDRIKKQGELRTQYHHVIDIMPTLLEAAHINAPTQVDGVEQQRMDGTSMMYSFDAPDAQSTRHTQYYEIQGNRAIYHDGWLANTTPRNMPWDMVRVRPNSDVATYDWELYDLRADFSQSHNLAASEPARLKEMQALFDTEAKKNNVYPIMDSGSMSRAMSYMRATGAFKTHYEYWGKDIRLPNAVAPPIFMLPFTIEADIEVPKNDANGVILAAGSLFGGWSFYLKDGKPVAYAAASQLPDDQFRIAAANPLATGKNKLRFEFDTNNSGVGTLVISANGEEIARGDVPRYAHFMAGLGETFDIGRDSNAPVSDDYQNEGQFTGEIQHVQVDVKIPLTMMLKGALNRLTGES